MAIPGLEQLPVLPVVIPLVAAPLTLLMKPGRAPWAWATLVSWVTFVTTLLLLEGVWVNGPIEYAMGGWGAPDGMTAPLGITYYIDLANALVLTLVAGIASVVFPYAYYSVESEIDHRQTPAFYTALLICFTGLLGVTITGDAFNVFVFLEISSLSTYALVAMGARNDRRALTASFNYLVMGTIGATFFVIGIGLLYQATGTLNMLDLHQQLMGQSNRMVEAGFAFIITGIGLKLAMVPLHLWLPNAYCYAPSAISAFLAATATKVQVYIILRFMFTVFGFEFAFLDVALNAFIILGIAGMFYASFVAVFRDNVKQMLAYSSIAQIGYMLLGISFGTVDGVAASLIHVFNHALMKAALFMGVGCVVLRIGYSNFSAFNGLAKRMPWTAWGLIISGLSLVGVPLTVGFISKWKLMEAAFQTQTIIPPLLIVLLIGASSLLAAIYIGRLAYAMLLQPVPEDAEPVKEAPHLMRITMWIMVLANIWFFFQTDVTVGVATRAAQALLDTGLGYGGAY
ncbi:monovalent cation/H+ antiporter subunit D family protein [Parvularcula flava]|uniref:Cation:proton antiporter n=1 Tax=Aquisalinus luteolus TaxID=1566827 RepID=A0A8J3A445_9PROT|nr:monovalent cation/H+ antiporter subunit D family protein [Aquisalinus luteolus]NHK29562.1 monovalent cation/H+ antiporter subunit D family protein [Aquisalinus luteolus]GGI01569.1 cation:proton antiporter [Aquisalinus luteolus]